LNAFAEKRYFKEVPLGLKIVNCSIAKSVLFSSQPAKLMGVNVQILFIPFLSKLFNDSVLRN
jgi:hypothetical protein